MVGDYDSIPVHGKGKYAVKANLRIKNGVVSFYEN